MDVIYTSDEAWESESVKDWSCPMTPEGEMPVGFDSIEDFYEWYFKVASLRQRVDEWRKVAAANLQGMAICKQRVGELEAERDAALENCVDHGEIQKSLCEQITTLKSALKEVLTQLDAIRLAVEPYDDIKPRDWKSDRNNLRDAHQCAKEAIGTIRDALQT